jgi:hypothetical protein
MDWLDFLLTISSIIRHKEMSISQGLVSVEYLVRKYVL